jgi:peptide/nickel transport system permease protein
MMLAICISVSLGSGVFNTALALAVGTVPMIARQLRSSTMLINGQEYIEAARSFGESNAQIILTHVIPNTLAPIIVQTSLYIGGSIMGIAGLSFLGLGVQPPTPEWGNILNNGLDNIYDFATRWNVIVFPALIIVLAELAFNLLGDGLRDAMDPRMRK